MGCVCHFSTSFVHNELFGLLGVESQVVVGAPLRQVRDLFSIGRLIDVADEANHRCVVYKLDNGIRTMYRCAVLSEEGVEEGPQKRQSSSISGAHYCTRAKQWHRKYIILHFPYKTFWLIVNLEYIYTFTYSYI